MSKELDRLEYICKILKEKGIDIKWLFKEDYNTIKQRLESIDNANPSEAIECVDYIENKLGHLRYECKRTNNHRCDDLFIQEHIFNTIKQALLKAQEQEKENDKLKGQVNYLTEVGTEYQKILKIIKEKNVDIALLKECKNESEYNIEVQCHNENLMKPLEWWIRGKLTKEEFELLKRWLG